MKIDNFGNDAYFRNWLDRFLVEAREKHKAVLENIMTAPVLKRELKVPAQRKVTAIRRAYDVSPTDDQRIEAMAQDVERNGINVTGMSQDELMRMIMGTDAG
jgi:hypothetical protein